MRSCRIGRDVGKGELRASCTIVFDEGAVTFKNVDVASGPTDAERKQLLRLFGSPTDTTVGGKVDGRHWQGLETIPPGTERHFDAVCYRLPKPFGRMPSGGPK